MKRYIAAVLLMMTAGFASAENGYVCGNHITTEEVYIYSQDPEVIGDWDVDVDTDMAIFCEENGYWG